MLLPEIRVKGGVFHGISAVDHSTAARIDTHVGNSVNTVGVLEENKVSGLKVIDRNRCADPVKASRVKSAHVYAFA